MANQNRTRTESEDHDDSNYEPDAHFEPVVPLPDLVEVQTGEEGEEVRYSVYSKSHIRICFVLFKILFKERAKLFRFFAETKEFKERGLGDLKVLKHRETGKVRVVMRREQVFKLCANHYITKDMKISPMAKSDRAFMWSCQDFSEGEVQMETLAAKFKHPEQALEFKKIFEDSVSGAKDRHDTPKKSEVEKDASQQKSSGFGDSFKPKEGSWTCQGCTVTNESSVSKCPCCGTEKEGKAQSIFGGAASNTPLFGKSSPASPQQFSFKLDQKSTPLISDI